VPSGEHRRLARALFLRLIDPGVTEQDTTRRRAPLAELSLPNPEQTKIIREATDAFVAARLLITNEIAGTTTIEVSHEALIREWTRLAEWLREAREDITLQQAISADAAEWVRRGRPIDRLYRGTQLTEAQIWAERNVPNADEVDFLHAGAVEHEYQEDVALNQKMRELDLQRSVVSRQRLLITALSIFSVIVIILASLAEISREQANTERQQADTQAQIASSRAFAAQANDALSKNQLDKALLLSVLANQTDNTFDARDSLLNALQFSPHLLTMLQVADGSTVNQVLFSPAGQTLISIGSAGDRGELTFWNTMTKKSHTLHLDFRGSINSVPNWALSPNGQMVAGASDQGLWLWNTSTGAQIAQLEPANPGRDPLLSDITPITFSPDGRLLASSRCTQYDATNHCIQGRILIWNVALQQPASQLFSSGPFLVTHLAFSPDGKTLLSSSQELPAGSGQGNLQLWDVTSGKVLTRAFADFTGVVWNFALSPDGKILAASDARDSIYLWDVATQKALGPPLNARNVKSLAFSPDGQTLAAGSTDKTLQLWDVITGQPLGTPLLGHGDSITSLAFNLDGQMLASSDASGAILLWNMATESAIEHTLPYTARVFSAIYSPDGKMIAAGDNKGAVILRNATSGNLLGTLDATLDPIIQGNITFNGTALTIESLAFSPDKRLLAAGRYDGMIFLWNAATLQPIAHFRGEKHLRNIVFNADSHVLAASYENGAILLWNVTTGRVLHRLVHPVLNSNTVSTIAFSPDGKVLASGSNDSVVFWNVATGKPTGQQLTGHQTVIKSVAFSPDGHTLASIDENSAIMLWDIRTMEPLLSQPFLNTDPDLALEVPFQTGLAFSPDGSELAAGGYQSVTVWNVTDVTHPERFAHAFHRPISDFLTANIRGVAFSPAGQQLLVISDTYTENYAVTLWDINTASWASSACSIANRNFTLNEWQQFVGENTPYQRVCSSLPVDASVTQDELKQAHFDVLAGRTGVARLLYRQAAQEAAQLDDADLANNVCWYASTDQFAREVLSACDLAVSLNPYYGNYYDSRGVARALTGNKQGANNDFKFYIQWATEEYVNSPGVDPIIQAQYKQLIAERMAWIRQLQAGHNPFDTKMLRYLRVESRIDG